LCLVSSEFRITFLCLSFPNNLIPFSPYPVPFPLFFSPYTSFLLLSSIFFESGNFRRWLNVKAKDLVHKNCTNITNMNKSGNNIFRTTCRHSVLKDSGDSVLHFELLSLWTCSSSCILKEHDVSVTESLSVIRWKGNTTMMITVG
jgi:hypothetical protein